MTLLAAEGWARHSQGLQLWSWKLEGKRFSDRELTKRYNRKFAEARPDFFRGYPYQVEWFDSEVPWPRYLFIPSRAFVRRGDGLEPAGPGDVPYWSSNAWGLRGPELRPAGSHVARVVCLGASTTEGSQGDQETYPHFLAQRLGDQVEVVNAGHHGHDLRDLIEVLRSRVAPLFPDVVIFYAAANNVGWTDHLRYVPCGPGTCWPLAYPEWRRPLLRRSALVDLMHAHAGAPPPMWHGFSVGHHLEASERYRDNLRKLADVAAGMGTTLVLASFVTVAHEGLVVRYSDRPGLFRDLYRKYFPLTPAEIAKIYARYNEVAREVAVERGLPYADVAAEFPRELRYFAPSDHFHLSPEGNRRVADQLARFLKRTILATALERSGQAQ